MRTCLLECPFVFNSCPIFGQSAAGVSQSGNILKGAAKKDAREFIYQYLIRKIEAVHLYMYFGNLTRLLDFIQKQEDSITKSADLQASVADFLFVCSEICVVNEKQKKNIEKIVKESHTGNGLELNDGEDQPMASNKEPEADESGKTGKRGGKKNQPTIAQALQMVEKIVPAIPTIDEHLRRINANRFESVLDKLCTNICVHFESLIEYAQPREFWSKYSSNAKKLVHVANQIKAAAKKSTVTTKAACSSNNKNQVPESPTTIARAKQISKEKAANEENDSGQFTIDDDDDTSKPSAPSVSTKKKIQPPSVHNNPESDDDSLFSDESDTFTVPKRKKSLQSSSVVNKKPKSTPTRKSSRR